MTPPMMPVLLVIDGGLEDPISHEISSRLRIPRLTVATPPQGDSGAVAEAARLLVNAQNPVIVADRAARHRRDHAVDRVGRRCRRLVGIRAAA